jgi:2-succinyl-6-hydroxy-2,4-cyclohexadiene-1-carboxylate synthase
MTLIPLRHGAALNVEIQSGKPDAPVLVLLHGFTGSSRTWSSFRERVGDDLTTVAIDAMGHGKSAVPNDPNRYTMANGIADIVDILDKLNIGHCFLLGYSMGGRMALHMALNAPRRIQGLILESATAGIRNEEERRARLQADEKWAMLLEKEGITAFVNHWEQLPLFASQKVNLPREAWQGQRERRLGNSTRGLAASLRGAGTAARGARQPLGPPANALDAHLTDRGRAGHEIYRNCPRNAPPHSTFGIDSGAGRRTRHAPGSPRHLRTPHSGIC